MLVHPRQPSSSHSTLSTSTHPAPSASHRRPLSPTAREQLARNPLVGSFGTGIAAAHLTSFLLWTFLPSVLSNTLLSAFYNFSPSSRPTLPPNAPPQQVAHENRRAQAHHRVARVVLITGYLIYTLLSTYFSQSYSDPSFYALLGLPRWVVEAEGAPAVKSHWRKLARVYHPDKVGKQGEALFVELRKAVECLEDDTKRWAYDRFGPTVLEWGTMKTQREYVVRGAQATLAFYIFAAGSIMLLSLFRKEEKANRFWRYFTLATTLAAEFSLVLSSAPSPLLSLIIPNRLTFEHVQVLRQLFISSSMAFSQLVPLLFPNDPSSSTPAEHAAHLAMQDAESLRPLIQRLAEVSALVEKETESLQAMEITPLLVGVDGDGAEETRRRQQLEVERVKSGMVDIYSDLRIKNDPQLGRVWEDAVKRVSRAKRALDLG
ncbi:protein of heat shock protein DnaJ family [Pseudohyphozyma bogoriensis]|nr:protein of heat shock protein DnaJ family [Pseudohyphozyma bogoriensis]